MALGKKQMSQECHNKIPKEKAWIRFSSRPKSNRREI
jgi:hypothetical protein